MSSSKSRNPHDADEHKGAVEQDRPGQPTNTDHLQVQNAHRNQRPSQQGQDTDFPEPGSSPEYSMQKQEKPQNANPEPKKPEQQKSPDLHPGKDPDGNAGAQIDEQDPGHAQKRNQGDKKDDDLAA